MGAIHQALLAYKVAGGGVFADPSDVTSIWDWWEPSLDSGSNGVGLQTLTGQANGRNWTQATSGSRPLYDTTNALNGHAVLTFNTNRFLNGPDMSGIPQGVGSTKQGHIFIIVKTDADPQAAGGDTGLWKMTGASDSTHFNFPDGNIYDSILKGARDNFGNPAASLTSWRVYEASIIASSGVGVPNGEYIVRLDGTQIFTNGTVQASFIAAPTLGRNLANQGFKGKMAGLYLFTQKLSTDDRNNMVSYINTRFGLSMT